ncbi:Uncharacterized protein DAT39_018837, partial [Clarias magur]
NKGVRQLESPSVNSLLVIPVAVGVGIEVCNLLDMMQFTDFILAAAILLCEHKNNR